MQNNLHTIESAYEFEQIATAKLASKYVSHIWGSTFFTPSQTLVTTLYFDGVKVEHFYPIYGKLPSQYADDLTAKIEEVLEELAEEQRQANAEWQDRYDTDIATLFHR